MCDFEKCHEPSVAQAIALVGVEGLGSARAKLDVCERHTKLIDKLTLLIRTAKISMGGSDA